MSLADTDTKPWYRQFWPWFIIALPASVVVAGLITVFIAFRHADTVVVDDYYREGLAINQRLAQDELAAELGVAAEIDFDTLTGEVLVVLSGEGELPQTLELMLLHPVDAGRDQTLALSRIAADRYRGDLDNVPASRYYLRLAPAGEPSWRLNGELDFRAAKRIRLAPGAALGSGGS
ncbi:MAG: FixH family protein [Porticoccaceae bacterium]